MAIATETVTLTFGDCAENHRGMQSLGQMAQKGITNEELEKLVDTNDEWITTRTGTTNR